MSKHGFHIALATSLATLILIVVGGTVNPTGSSLACPDWPTCYGSFFPEMKNGVEYEHTHRLVATGVGLLTCVLAVWTFRVKPAHRPFRILGAMALLMVIVQGVLGGVTVLLRLPLLASAGHLALSMIFLCLLIYITLRAWTSRRLSSWRVPTSGTPDSAVLARRVAMVSVVAVYAQILLGALVRHTNSGHACDRDFPWCAGAVWPTWAPGQLHMLHRWAGVATLLIVFAVCHICQREARSQSNILSRLTAVLGPLIVFSQFLIGILTVTSGIAVVPAAAHLGMGAFLLADLWLMYLGFRPWVQRALATHAGQESSALAVGHGEVTP